MGESGCGVVREVMTAVIAPRRMQAIIDPEHSPLFTANV